MPQQHSSLARTSLFLGGCTALSRLMGLLRDMAMAWLVGGGLAADALVAAMRVPHILRRLLAEGSLSMTLTAAIVQQEHVCPGGERALMRAVAVRLGGLLALLLAAGWLGAPWLLEALAPGLGLEGERMAASLFRLCLPYAVAAVMAAVSMAALHSKGAFFWPAVSPLIFNGVILLFAVAAALGFGNAAVLLAGGLTCAGFVQWIVQARAAHCVLVPSPVEVVSPRRQAVRERRIRRAAVSCLRRLPPGILGAAAPQLATLAAMMVASFGCVGSMAALYYAERLMELPLGVIGVCLGMASLPRLSHLAAENDWAGFGVQLGTALRLALLFGLAATAGLAAVGPDLVDILLGHGAFGPEAVRASVLALWAYLPGLPACAVARPLLAACNAAGAWRATAWGALGAVAITAGAGFALAWGLPATLDVCAPALAVSIGMWAHAFFLWWALHRRRRRGALPFGRLFSPAGVARACAAGAAAGLAAWGVLAGLHALAADSIHALTLPPACAAGVGAWLLTLAVLRDADMLTVWRMLRHRT